MSPWKRIAGSAMLLLTFGGCVGLSAFTPGKTHELETSLSPSECAWVASKAMAVEVITPSRRSMAPVLLLSVDGYYLEARSRPGALFRFLKGGGFSGEPTLNGDGVNDGEKTLESLLATAKPMNLIQRKWTREKTGCFPIFYDGRILIRIIPSLQGGSKVTLKWEGTEGREPGQNTLESLKRILRLAEPISSGNTKLIKGDVPGALTAYDRAYTCGQSPWSGEHALLLARIQFNRGLALFRLGDLNKACIAFGGAAILDSSLERAHLLEALTAFRINRYERVRKIAGVLLGAGKSITPRTRRVIKTLYARCGRPRRGQDVESLLLRGREILSRGKAKEAHFLFLIARTRKRGSLPALRGLAAAECMMGKYQRARDHLLLGLSLESESPALLADLAKVESRRRNYGLALHFASNLGARSPAFRRTLKGISPAEAVTRLILTGEGPNLLDTLESTPLQRSLTALTRGDGKGLIDLSPIEPVAGRREALASPGR